MYLALEDYSELRVPAASTRCRFAEELLRAHRASDDCYLAGRATGMPGVTCYYAKKRRGEYAQPQSDQAEERQGQRPIPLHQWQVSECPRDPAGQECVHIDPYRSYRSTIRDGRPR